MQWVGMHKTSGEVGVKFIKFYFIFIYVYVLIPVYKFISQAITVS